jgi:hypothetical protein
MGESELIKKVLKDVKWWLVFLFTGFMVVYSGMTYFITKSVNNDYNEKRITALEMKRRADDSLTAIREKYYEANTKEITQQLQMLSLNTANMTSYLKRVLQVHNINYIEPKFLNKNGLN